ncbi:MAG: coenzyme F420-0:L-glutamate ligase [Actinomycetota bacterium]|nr:coenzyme F420-0:L-glutamate ligase [Actinomycetota bacterium]MDK1027452.1 coenzyme F420-0:L-glutamate ligase [Actinomycetota bacterium]MDK1038601.1 coenzyme F420-0:L-glutamate ligase [Actinomycetota bacterium]MDK1096985.1 coenzyme F420-0:L-glutamate ligase [Actinomycetota bacterium]MDK1103852.1 coenzyme F420-0:L-glutamate ligase [Actinomycetota bacterium]
MTRLDIRPVPGIREIESGDDLARMIVDAVAADGWEIEDRDVVVVTHKVVSKQEGRIVPIPTEAAYRQLVENESVRIVRRRGDLVIAQTTHGFICANAAVDRSNIAEGFAVLLPVDPDRSAHRLRMLIERATGASIGVVITDTFGRPWRRGLVDVAIGVSGLPSILDLIGTSDAHGNELNVTQVAVVDEIAAAADLVMGKASQIPVAIVRGLNLEGSGRATDLIRPPDEDLFR